MGFFRKKEQEKEKETVSCPKCGHVHDKSDLRLAVEKSGYGGLIEECKKCGAVIGMPGYED